jgi:hypothetical protein
MGKKGKADFDESPVSQKSGTELSGILLLHWFIQMNLIWAGKTKMIF